MCLNSVRIAQPSAETLVLSHRFHLLSLFVGEVKSAADAAVHKHQTVEGCTSRRCRQVKKWGAEINHFKANFKP